MSQPVTVQFSRPSQLVPQGRTTLYTATGSGQLTILIGNDGSADVVVYIETDGMISDPIPGNVGTTTAITVPFTQYLLVYADNFGYTAALAPSISVSGTVTPPPATPQQTAVPAFFGPDLNMLLNFMVNMMFIMMFMNMMTQIMRGMQTATRGL